MLFFYIQLTECGAHGVLGANVVKHVSMVQGKEHVCAIIQNQLLMEHSALVLVLKRKTVAVFPLVQVRAVFHNASKTSIYFFVEIIFEI